MQLLQRGGRLLPLDGLRALAFGAVFVQHAFGGPFTWSGVDLFFVLSGYLITRILLGSMHQPNYFGNFYLRRTFRIFPVYYAVLVLASLALPAAAAMAPWCAFYLGNVHRAIYGDGLPLTPLWSLAVEEQFYLLWPLVLFRCPERLRWRLVLILLAAAPLFRVLTTAWWGRYAPQSLLPCRADVLAAGAALAILERERGLEIFRQWRRPLMALATFSGLAFAFVAADVAHDSDWYWAAVLEFDMLFYASVVALVLGALQTRPVRLLALPPVAYLGQISYGLYLVHVPMLLLVGEVLHGVASVVVAAAATLLLAVLSWHLLERPIMRWGQQRTSSSRSVISYTESHAPVAIAGAGATQG